MLSHQCFHRYFFAPKHYSTFNVGFLSSVLQHRSVRQRVSCNIHILSYCINLCDKRQNIIYASYLTASICATDCRLLYAHPVLQHRSVQQGAICNVDSMSYSIDLCVKRYAAIYTSYLTASICVTNCKL